MSELREIEYHYQINRNFTDFDYWGASKGRYKYQVWETDFNKMANRIDYGYTFTRWGARRKVRRLVKQHKDIETGFLS